jgi:putative endonuclease
MKTIGDHFEQQAEAWLIEKGWRILHRNFRAKTGELDLVAMDSGKLVFVEVKARKHTQYAGAAAAVDRRKQQKLIRTAHIYLRTQPQLAALPCRFDVIAFEPRQSAPGYRINWIRSAFTA